ncbi:MAG: hypothetical protein N2109_00920 [Fimbriimonadales bacterium]|nr:hypothetical protein [Fimbriimonadales bacterium]
MTKRTGSWVIALSLLTVPGMGSGQEVPGLSSFNQLQSPAADAKPVLGGKPSIDVIVVEGSLPSVPLLRGGVLPGSESVTLNGQALERGTDYQIDYPAGVVYLMRAVKPGSVLRASYRYEPNYRPPAQQFAGLGAFRYSLVPGAMNLTLGMGLTERTQAGVFTSNVYGWNNALKFGSSGSLSGAFIVGERRKTAAASELQQERLSTAPAETGQAVVQNLKLGWGKGSLEVDYQDVEQSFSHFGALQDAGFTAEQVAQLQKERGLTRIGFSFKDIGFGTGAVSQSFRQVGNDDGKLTWTSYGFQSKDLSLGYESRRIDPKFRRFQDLAEQDRQQLAAEAGLQRERFSAAWRAGLAKLDYQQSLIEDFAGTGAGIRRDSIAIDAGKVRFSLQEQEIDAAFTRFNSLFEPEKAQWAREQGLRRRNLALDATVFGGTQQPLQFRQSLVASGKGEYRSTTLDAAGKTWSLSHAQIGATARFGRLGSLAQSEVEDAVRRIADAYQPGLAVKPDEIGWFARGDRLSRELTRLTWQPGKGWTVRFDEVRLDGQRDGGWLQSIGVSNPRMNLSIRRQNLGDRFSEIGNLMTFERERLGTVAGLRREDVSLALNLGGERRANVDTTSIDLSGAGLARARLSYQDKGVEISYGSRSVDEKFGAARALIDSERELLASLQGFNERDFQLKWKLLPSLSVELFDLSASSEALDQRRDVRNLFLAYNPDAKTKLDYLKSNTRHQDELHSADLFRAAVERLTLVKDLGRFGVVRYLRETTDYLNAGLIGYEKEIVAYQARLDARTEVATEQARTRFDDGTNEKVSSHTVRTALGPRTGVQVAEVAVDRRGSERDERKRNVGFWWDLGNGLRLSYGYDRQAVGELGVTKENLLLASSPGASGAQLGNVAIGAASYQASAWDEGRVQATSNVQLSTARPMRLGPLQDVKMSFGFDTASDRTVWLRENRLFAMDGKWGSNTFALQYRSQMHSSGYRAVDRSIGFSTDQDPKRWLVGSLYLKERSLPATAEDVQIQNISLTARPMKGVELSHQTVQNPEVTRGDALLGSVIQAARSERWKLNVRTNDDTSVGGSFEELYNAQTRAMTRVGGLHVTLRQKSGSPIELFYGLEEADVNGRRQTAHRYHLKFDQRPGPNQALSVFVGNVSYEHNFERGGRDNWTIRLDYQLRF